MAVLHIDASRRDPFCLSYKSSQEAGYFTYDASRRDPFCLSYKSSQQAGLFTLYAIAPMTYKNSQQTGCYRMSKMIKT